MVRCRLAMLAILATCSWANGANGQDKPLPDGTKEALKQIAVFRHPAGLKVSLFAAEPMLLSPVAFCLDEKGRVFVAEEHRFNRGTEENRTRPFMLDDDLQIRTVDDRLAMYRKWEKKFPGGMDWFSKHADQVRLLVDRDGDGKADHSTIFAGGFNQPLDGLAAGVIARDGVVYFTCIPHLWMLKDTKGTGQADVRVPLHRGFGVNCAFLGHDLHGLAWGPDGRLYFSVGDRGFHVVTKEGRTLSGPRTGGVFRCNPDGTELELLHRGLRNPQELAFDQFGNLFADDNNCDKGDHARLVYVVDDGESGWNMAYQTIPEPYLTGPWHAERLWHLAHRGQPAWITPPIAPLGAGPSGFCFTSGLSLPERYRDRFFYCNYTGNGGIESFGVVPNGAGFSITDHHDFLKPISATDVDFGYDGKMYISDFVKLDWEGKSTGGRIYTVADPKRLDDPVVRGVRQLFLDGFQRPEAELVELLNHPDQRVRQRAQFALADRGIKSAKAFQRVLDLSSQRFARLHSVWGLWQLGRTHSETLRGLIPHLQDRDDEVRAQVVRVLGDCGFRDAARDLLPMLTDRHPRVRYFTAIALGKLKHPPAIEGLFSIAKENNDRDPFLRHAAVTGLARIGDANALAARVKDSSPAVRMAALLALRRLGDRRVAVLLNDENLDIVTEAARAIHDLPLEAELPALAALLDRYGSHPDAAALLRRAISANYRLGAPEHARRVARFASNSAAVVALRSEAVAALSDWASPPPRDRVTGFWSPLPHRDPKALRSVLDREVATLLSRSSGKLQTEVIRLVDRLNLRTDEAAVRGWLAEGNRDVATRVAALQLLATRKTADLPDLLKKAINDSQPTVRASARNLMATIDPAAALTSVETVLRDDQAPIAERQQALPLLTRLAGGSPILDQWADRFERDQVPPALKLDLIEAFQAAPEGRRKQALDHWTRSHPAGDALARFRPALDGGDAERGRDLFVGHAAAQCIRCHRIKGQGGDAGPDLTEVVKRHPEKTREFLLESMILPSAQVAPGFGSVTLTLTSGRLIAGIIKSETDQSVIVITPEGRTVSVLKKEIDERTAPTSAMPPMDRVLNPREMRDLIEFLATMK